MKKLFIFFILLILSAPHFIYSQWVQQSVPVSKPITGIKFINQNKGWACTSIGIGGQNYCYILYTSNSGTNWLIQDSTFNATFGAICVIDSNIVYAGGADFSNTSANLKKTTNGGLNWLLIPTPTNMAILDMVFLNKDSGWTSGGLFGPDVRTTTDGGLNWIVRTNGIMSQDQRIFFLNYHTGFCGAGSNLYITTDAGMNWTLNNNFSQSVQSIFFLDQNTGWCGLGLNRMYYTSNGGSNWLMQTLPPNSNSTVFDVFFLNSMTGYAGTSFDKIYKTTNGGINWGYQIDTGGSYRISILNNMYGWTCSLGSRIGYTTNGGGPIVGIIQIVNKIPSENKLYQNYPNPFNPGTKINFDVNKSIFVKISVYDILGRELSVLVESVLKAGSYEYYFDAGNFPSGVYFYRLTTGNFSETKRMVLIK